MQDYNTQLKVNIPAPSAINAILEISAWWAQDVEGAPSKVGDEFKVIFGKTWAIFRVTEISNERMTWLVTDCYLDMLENPKEWKDTRLIFQFSIEDGHTLIDIMHEGLTPDKECFTDCQKGWNFYLNESLYAWLEKKQGLPGEGIHAWLDFNGKVYRGKMYPTDKVATELNGDLLLLDVKNQKVEQVRSAYSVKSFDGKPGAFKGEYYMLLPNEPGLLDQMQSFVDQN